VTTRTVKIKVCGLSSSTNGALVAALGPEWIGFNFYRPSPRYISPRDAASMVTSASKRIGVFVDESYEAILSVAHEARLDGVQLHGDESPELCVIIRNQGLSVIKACNVEGVHSLLDSSRYTQSVDFLLFDAPRQGAKKGVLLGGTGVSIEWRELPWHLVHKAFFIAGGIDEYKIQEMLPLMSNPQFIGFDLNSKFETSPGIKDVERIKKLLLFLETVE
jgi:phosphoribosylanthranilate isomerase